MKKKIILSLLCLLSLIFVFNIFNQKIIAADTLREQVQTNLSTTGVNAGYGPTQNQTPSTLAQKIGGIISIILGFVGVIFLVLIIYSGFQWMTAGGNEETVTKAKKRLTNAVIGIVIIFAAYVITYFITQSLIGQTGYVGPQ